MPRTWIGFGLALPRGLARVAAVVTNTPSSRAPGAAAGRPPLSPSRPIQSARLLLRERRWLTAFGLESAGWLVYVAALRLAPLALVQAVTASGVAVLAFATARGHPSVLARREQAAVVLALVGLALLGLSLVGTSPVDRPPSAIGAVVWLGAGGVTASLLIAEPTRLARAASLGLAAGFLFADGDMSAKLVGYSGWWLLAITTLI